MVLSDIFQSRNEISKTPIRFQKLIELRSFSFLVDLMILLPVVSVILQLIQIHLELDFLSKALMGIFLFSLFQTFFLVLLGSTCGQLFFKLQVEIQSSPLNPTKSEAFLKYFSRQLLANFSFIAFSFPFLSFITNKKNQTFYDRLTETKVVFKNKNLNEPFENGFDIHPALVRSARRFQLLGYVFVMSLSLVLFNSYLEQEKTQAIVSVIKGNEHKRSIASAEEFKPSQCYLGSVGAASGGDLKKLILLNTTGLLSDECLAFYSEIDSKNEDQTWYWTAKILIETDLEAKNSYLNILCNDEKGKDSIFCQPESDKGVKASLREQILRELDKK